MRHKLLALWTSIPETVPLRHQYEIRRKSHLINPVQRNETLSSSITFFDTNRYEENDAMERTDRRRLCQSLAVE